MRLKCAGLGEAVLRAAVRADVRVVELVEPEALLALRAVDERVGEVGEVAARLPDLRAARGSTASMPTTSSRSCTIERHHASFTLRSISDAERAVVVARAEAAVDLGRREDEAAPLGRG